MSSLVRSYRDEENLEGADPCVLYPVDALGERDVLRPAEHYREGPPAWFLAGSFAQVGGRDQLDVQRVVVARVAPERLADASVERVDRERLQHAAWPPEIEDLRSYRKACPAPPPARPR